MVEHLQTRFAQFAGDFGQGDGRAGDGVTGGDRQRQRVTPAQCDQLVHGVGFGGDAPGTQASGQQGTRLVTGQDVQGQVAGTVAVDQRREPGAAGDQHRAGGAARQQRDHLVGGGRVVQHDQHPPIRDQAAVPRDLRVRVGRDASGLDAEGVEEPPYRHGRVHRLSRRAETVQVHEQLPVGESVQVTVRPRQDQPGLAHSSRTADGGDPRRHVPDRELGEGRSACGRSLHSGAPSVRRNRGQGVVQRVQLHSSSHEQRRCGGQLARHHPGGGRLGRVQVHATVHHTGLHHSAHDTGHRVAHTEVADIGRRGAGEAGRLRLERHQRRHLPDLVDDRTTTPAFHRAPPNHSAQWRTRGVRQFPRVDAASRWFPPSGLPGGVPFADVESVTAVRSVVDSAEVRWAGGQDVQSS
ncbi:hypothetical protein [Saccharothrix sp. 6-C]|uniref:hypothetical protein n=1 Tax=Saccharothrix sp. 6-C TaxID=2781735 RepID=UPI002E2E5360|nr:hypothetical protein [Saccharothrix sp. 6-C]